MGGPGSVLVDEGAAQPYLVLAKIISGFTARLLEVFSKDDGDDPGTERLFFKPIAQKSGMASEASPK